jgi:hypothetical protein
LQYVITNYFWEWAATKVPEKIKSVGFVSRSRLCHEHKMSATKNKFLFTKKKCLRKPEMFYITFDCENLNPARTRTFLCYRVQARAVQTSRSCCYRAKESLCLSSVIFPVLLSRCVTWLHVAAFNQPVMTSAGLCYY